MCVWRQTPPSQHVEHAELSAHPSADTALANRVAYLEQVVRSAGLDTTSPTSNANPIPPNSHANALAATAQSRPSSPRPPATLAISDLVQPHNDSPQAEVSVHDRFDHQILSVKDSASNACLARAQPLVGLLPQRDRCDALVDMYFETLEWIHHPIHVPSFNAWYRQFWTQGLTSRRCVQQLALLFSILCLAVHFGLEQGQDDPFDAVPSPNEDDVFYQASYDALIASGYLGHHSLAVLQTLILQGLYLNNSGQATTAHANLGLAIRIANAMGLSSLDSDVAASLSSRPLRNELDKEMGRRLYWSLICQDCYTASSCNFTYSIQPNQIKTSVFADLRDDVLLEAQDTEAMDSERQRTSMDTAPTTSSYHITKIPFALTARKTVDMHNDGTLTYAAVLKLEQENWDHFYALPDFFRLDKPDATRDDPHPLLGWGHGNTSHWNPSRIFRQQIQWQRLFMGITLHNRILRLHRPFLTRAYTDPTYHASKQSALASARQLLWLAQEGRRLAFPGLRWWVVLVHIFTAAVALCIDVHFKNVSPTSNASELQSHQAENAQLITLAIDTLKSASLRSKAASTALDIISTLFEQAQMAPGCGQQKRSRKRTRQDDDQHTRLYTDSSSAGRSLGSSDKRRRDTPVSSGASGPPPTDSFETWLGSDWSSLLDVGASASLTPVTTDVLTADLLGAINAFVSQ